MVVRLGSGKSCIDVAIGNAIHSAHKAKPFVRKSLYHKSFRFGGRGVGGGARRIGHTRLEFN